MNKRKCSNKKINFQSKSIDEQHEIFLSTIDKLSKKISQNKKFKDIEIIVNELLEYASYYFENEEEFLTSLESFEIEDSKRGNILLYYTIVYISNNWNC